MQISSTLAFAAAPDRVAAMFIDPGFATWLGSEVGALNVTATPLERGLSAVYTIASPEAAALFLGPHMTLVQTTSWDESPAADKTRGGRLTMSLDGLPASADGPLSLTPTPTGSEVTYAADFHVRVPVIGGKLEKLVGANLTKLLDSLGRIGTSWLDQHPEPRTAG